MKKILSVFLACIMIFSFSACSSENKDAQSLLSTVLNSEKTFIAEDGTAVLLKNYFVGNGERLANPTQFVFVDFDDDNIEEMVINISDLGYFLVLRVDEAGVYGYEFSARTLNSLKTDGSFSGSNGAASTFYCRLSFENNKPIVIDEAVADSDAGHFELNGEKASPEEMAEFAQKWHRKKDVEWTKIENNITNDPSVINLNNYISVKFSGTDSEGYGSVAFDKEKFLLDHIGNVSFNKENLQVYRELYGYPEKSAANTILKYISVSLDKVYNLSNGDTVKVVWEIDTEKVETYFVWDYICPSVSLAVTGLNPTKPQGNTTGTGVNDTNSTKPQETTKTYKITLDPNGGSVSKTTQNVSYYSSYTLEDPEREGYIFEGWYDGETEYCGGTWLTPKDVTLKAKWTIKRYYVSVNHTDGGSVSGGKAYYEYNSTVTVSAKTNLGYTWLGWYDDSKCLSTKQKYSFAMGDAQVDLVAKWEKNEDISEFSFHSTETTCTITGYSMYESNCIIPNYVTGIGNHAFYRDNKLTSITIPNSVTSIGDRAFWVCRNLESIVLPNSVTNIGESAFSDCDSLTSIVIPKGTMSISECMLDGCFNLTNVVIHENVTFIGKNAFRGCTKLTTITFQGTMAKWNAITFGDNWNRMVPATNVVCTDGTVALS